VYNVFIELRNQHCSLKVLQCLLDKDITTASQAARSIVQA